MGQPKTAEEVMMIIDSLPEVERARLIAEIKRQDFLSRWQSRRGTLSDEEINRMVEESRRARGFYNTLPKADEETEES